MPSKVNRPPRLSVVISRDVRAKFQRLADARGCSLSQTLSDWLCDSVEGAEVVAGMVEAARKSPHSLAARGLELAGTIRMVSEELIDATARGPVTKTPRPGNTGGNSASPSKGRP